MSYVSQQFLLFDNSSNANFRNWAGAIDVALTTSGWVVTSDTGQTDPSSASVPSAGTFIYRIYEPADALQTGSTQFFLKIKYGTSSGSPAGPRFQMQLATATDGAGNLTGLTSTNWEPASTDGVGAGSVITYDCYFSGDTDRFGMLMWRSKGQSQSRCMTTIERTKNTDGTNSSDGVCINNVSFNAVGGSDIILFGISSLNAGTTGALANRSFCVPWNNSNSSAAFNNNIPVHPTMPYYGKVGNPLTTLAWVHNQDVAEGCIFTTTLYGATRTYFATLIDNVSWPNGSSRACMRYD